MLNINIAFSQDLKIRLEPIDAIYSGESVNVKLIITNKSEEDIVIYHWLSLNTIMGAADFYITFDITVNDTNSLLYNHVGPTPMFPHIKDIYRIKPNDCYEETINLVDYYLETDTMHVAESKKRIWHDGVYSIGCKYSYKHDKNHIGGRELWEGEAESNIIVIKVENY